jgi:hypothetical protein
MPNTRPPDTENPGFSFSQKSQRPTLKEGLLVFMKIALVHFFLFLQNRTGSRIPATGKYSRAYCHPDSHLKLLFFRKDLEIFIFQKSPKGGTHYKLHDFRSEVALFF